MTDVQKEIEHLREIIDRIDEKLIEGLNDRAKIVLEIRDLKAKGGLPIYDPRREEEIFEKISAKNKGPLYDDALKGVYEAILHCMKDLES
ncbi:MAG: chorismate mutase [Actinomycetota bacterium]|nr:chorismate mutase [Actinomycetota bacterium]